jgi:hypothetical protein
MPPGSSPGFGTLPRLKVGDVVGVQGIADVSVDAAEYATRFASEHPDRPHYRFLAVRYTYRALVDGALMDPSEQWAVVWNGTSATAFAFVRNGPSPGASRTRLSAGQVTTGWLVYEVPEGGTGELWWEGAPIEEGADAAPIVFVVALP